MGYEEGGGGGGVGGGVGVAKWEGVTCTNNFAIEASVLSTSSFRLKHQNNKRYTIR